MREVERGQSPTACLEKYCSVQFVGTFFRSRICYFVPHTKAPMHIYRVYRMGFAICSENRVRSRTIIQQSHKTIVKIKSGEYESECLTKTRIRKFENSYRNRTCTQIQLNGSRVQIRTFLCEFFFLCAPNALDNNE